MRLMPFALLGIIISTSWLVQTLRLKISLKNWLVKLNLQLNLPVKFEVLLKSFIFQIIYV